MLGKLLKYDLKWTYKLLVIYYGLALVFALLGRGLSLIDNSTVFDILSKISCGTAVAMIFNILINNIIRLWVRYIQNIYKDESYLTHTLPVKKSEIYLSKSLSALITMFTSLVVVAVTFIICYWNDGLIDFVKMIYPGITVDAVVITLIVLVAELLFMVYLGYLAITIGYGKNHNKLLMSFASGFILYFVSSVISLVCLFVVGLFNKDILNLFTTMNEVIDIGLLKFLLIIALIIYLIYIFICNVVSNKLLQKGVNVD